jgi:hypothetical protein
MKRRLGQLIGRNVPVTGGFPAAFADWSVRHEITIPQTTSVLTDFPVYVDLSDLSATFWSAIESAAVSTVQGDSIGGDIRVTQSDGETEVPFEPVKVNGTTDSGELHFKATTSNVGTTTYYIYGGNSAATAYATNATNGAEAVWSNGFTFVDHGDGSDSTGNGNTATGVSVTLANTSGLIGEATALDGTADYISYGDKFDAVSSASFTFSMLHKRDTAATFMPIFGKGESSASLQVFRYNNNNILSALFYSSDNLSAYNSTAQYANTSNYHVVTLTHTWGSGADTEFYYDGVNDGTASYVVGTGADVPGNSTQPFTVGSTPNIQVPQWFDGIVDETRLSSVIRSADWISNQDGNLLNSASWYSLGTVETN